MKIRIKLEGTEGEQTRDVQIAETGASIKEICKAGNIDVKNKDFTVNDKPATLDTHVGKADVLAAKERNQAPVAVSARPQGA